jgi:anti-sigma regulatory factor (Ser/Thr protein kinase)
MTPSAALSSPVLVVIEDDLSEAQRCRCRGSQVLPLSAAPPVGTRRLLMGKATLLALRLGLAAPFEGFIEAGADCLRGERCRCLEVSREGGILLSLLTASAYALDPLTLFCAALAAKFPQVSHETLGAIETCLGEAISNALIHGNLAIGSELRATPKGLVRMGELIQERLEDPHYAQRRLEILAPAPSPDVIRISVTDQGGGYDVEAESSKAVSIDAKCGRGLGIMRDNACSVSCMDGGRSLVLEF